MRGCGRHRGEGPGEGESEGATERNQLWNSGEAVAVLSKSQFMDVEKKHSCIFLLRATKISGS